jgi:hypothetical protein
MDLVKEIIVEMGVPSIHPSIQLAFIWIVVGAYKLKIFTRWVPSFLNL